MLLLISIAVGIVVLFSFSSERSKQKEVSFSQFMNMLSKGEVVDVTIKGDQVYGKRTDQETFVVNVPRYYEDLIPMLYDRGIQFRIKTPDSEGLLFAIISNWLPIILIIGV